ncbi:hypothetical protein FDECE_7804, partial [Fusarium decemcellulare]
MAAPEPRDSRLHTGGGYDSIDSTPSSSISKRYDKWKTLINERQSTTRTPLSPQLCLTIWEEALGILNTGSKKQHQDLVRDLVNANLDSEGHIIQTVQLSATGGSVGLRATKSFLKVITHPSLFFAPPPRIHLGRIYAFFRGTNDMQSIEVLSLLCQQALETCEDLAEDSSSAALDTAMVISQALRSLLIGASQFRLCSTLPDLLELMERLVQRLGDLIPGAGTKRLENRMSDLKSVAAGASLTRLGVTMKQPVASSSRRKAETPGWRHDNDFSHISRISILPTIQEISSNRAEYLPSTNFLNPHVLDDPLERYIDTTFRLVRHDTLGPIKEALRHILASKDVSTDPCSSLDFQGQVYLGASITSMSATIGKRMEAVVSFKAPSHVARKDRCDQSDWWEAPFRLDEGKLVCFISPLITHRQSMLFFRVTAKNVREDTRQSASRRSVLVSNVNPPSPPSITMKLATNDRTSLSLLTRLYIDKVKGFLVEFNGLYVDAYLPVLENLQRIQREGQIAFQEWILPSPAEGQEMEPPLYARQPGFVFPLGCIAKDKKSVLRIDPMGGIDNINMQELEAETGLDPGQCHGLAAALTREYALIQGPPGTGKSYLGVQIVRVLLAVKEQAGLGPIVVCCYTNHALDQFLKHLLDCNITKVVRIGSRSVAPELTNKNLQVLRRRFETAITSSQSSLALNTYIATAAKALASLSQAREGASWALLKDFLLRHNRKIHKQLEQKHDDGPWAFGEDHLVKWLRERPSTTNENSPRLDLVALTCRAEDNIRHLSPSERQLLMKDWMRKHVDNQIKVLLDSIDGAEQKYLEVDKTQAAVSRRTLAQADVIGITTTTLARRSDLLRSVKPKVVICEEAGELKEVDVISALIPGVEHLIQIGDHRQLRPQVNNLSLGRESATGGKWQLDRSQFERRAVGEPGLVPAPLVQLSVQRRMRPEISQLIRSVYPQLQDHESVVALPGVTGMQQNLFWLEHKHRECATINGISVKSLSNVWEAQMAAALAYHLIRRGEYKAGDIALLTPYTRQLQKLKFELRRNIENAPRDGKHTSVEKLQDAVRVATVDNFQGEEAKVVIVSLVRSNPDGNVGFLGTENRINVLLSRAQHGIYLVGNSETYLKVPMWAECMPEDRACQLHKGVRASFDHLQPYVFCGEDCPMGYCQQCGNKADARVDLLEFRSYSNVNLDESPIVVLACGHFFTGETLDGLLALGQIYARDDKGNFSGFKDCSDAVARSFPFCPDCKRPIRQFFGKRYGRVINQAFMNEVPKRLLIGGRGELDRLERQLQDLE